MFSKRCPGCEKKIKQDFKFCPFCSKNLISKYDQEDYGFLGRNDFVEENMDFTDTFVEKMFNSVIKLFEKQMKNIHNDMNNPEHNPMQDPRRNLKQNPNFPGLNVKFFVNGEKVFPEKRNVNQPLVKINNYFPKEKMRKFSELPKKEPKSRIKRLSGKVIYELYVPGVKTINDVLINQLESSIEIKALSKDKVYSKNLNINLPILRYHLVNGSLIIEMRGK